MTTFFIFAAKYLFVLPVLMLGGYFFLQPRQEQKNMMLFAIPAALLAYVLALIAGHLYFDPRPFVVGHFTPLVPHAADNGFPSDHTLLASALAAIGMYWNRRLGLSLWIIAAIIAVARVYVGVHHTIDVVGSMLIALAAVAAWHAVYRRSLQK